MKKVFLNGTKMINVLWMFYIEEHSMVMLTSHAFETPYEYLYQKETQTDVTMYTEYLNNVVEYQTNRYLKLKVSYLFILFLFPFIVSYHRIGIHNAFNFVWVSSWMFNISHNYYFNLKCCKMIPPIQKICKVYYILRGFYMFWFLWIRKYNKLIKPICFLILNTTSFYKLQDWVTEIDLLQWLFFFKLPTIICNGRDFRILLIAI